MASTLIYCRTCRLASRISVALLLAASSLSPSQLVDTVSTSGKDRLTALTTRLSSIFLPHIYYTYTIRAGPAHSAHN